MDQIVYICTGSCKAEISKEEYDQGLTKCGTAGCNMQGHTFAARFKCKDCGAYYKPGQKHSHLA